MLQDFIVPALSFGISAAVIPGPLIAYLVNTTVRQGWRKALLVLVAPLITDAPIIILMTFILGQLPAEALRLIQLGGGMLLLYIAWGTYGQYRAESLNALAMQRGGAGESGWRGILLTGVLMNFLSPGPWLFWAIVNGPLLVRALDASAGHALAFLATFYGVFLLGLGAWVFVFHHARRVRIKHLGYVILATVLLLLYFGLSLITAAFGREDNHLLIVLLVVAAEFLRQRWLARQSAA